MESCVHMHALANVKHQSNEVQILYTGYLLDSIISPDANESWLAHYNVTKMRSKVLQNDIWAVLKILPMASFYRQFCKQIGDGYQASFRQASKDHANICFPTGKIGSNCCSDNAGLPSLAMNFCTVICFAVRLLSTMTWLIFV